MIHSHKSYAQSWILAGEGINGEYEVETVQDMARGTNAIFALVDHRTITHRQLSSTIVNTGKFVKVENVRFRQHVRDVSYVVPAAAFHISQVSLPKAHGTIFFFDASRDYTNDGGVSLGPKELHRVKQFQDPGGFMASTLARVIEALRSWESGLKMGLSLARRGEWPSARANFEKIVMTWNPLPDDNPGATLSSSSNDVQGLSRYLEIAQALAAWAQHVVQTREHLTKADTVAAQKHFDFAKRECRSMPDTTIITHCEAIQLTS